MKKIIPFLLLILMVTGIAFAGIKVPDGKINFGVVNYEWLRSFELFGNDPNQNTCYGDTNFPIVNTSGNYDSVFGFGAFGHNKTGKYCCAFGWNALTGGINNHSCVALGPESILLGGSNSIGVGDSTLKSQEPACDNDNIALGHFAGATLKRGKKCLLLGYKADLSDPNISYAACIGGECKVSTAKQMVIRSYNDIVFQDSNSGVAINTVTIKGGMVGVNTMTPTSYIDTNSPSFRVRIFRPPDPNTSCSKGEVRLGQYGIYVCIDPNAPIWKWKRAALGTW